MRGGTLFLVNTSDIDTEVTIASTAADDDEEPSVVQVPAGAAVQTSAPADAILTSDQPIHAGVRVSSATEMAGYPILPLTDRATELTVFPR